MNESKKTSYSGLMHIAGWEGFVDHAYYCIAGYKTIGYGHVIKPNELIPAKITKEQGLDLLALDVEIAEQAVKELFTIELSQNQFDAAVSFTFNLGKGNLKNSSFLKYANEGKINEAGEALLLWCKYKDPKTKKLVKSQGLYNRRLSEKSIWLKESDKPII